MSEWKKVRCWKCGNEFPVKIGQTSPLPDAVIVFIMVIGLLLALAIIVFAGAFAFFITRR